MSYKYTVLQDKPSSFFLLDEVRSGDIGSYNSLRDIFATYQDLKDNGVSYSALSGLPVYDYSGNSHHGYAINASIMQLMPLVSGGVRGTLVEPETIISYTVNGIANKYYADNSFDIELWAIMPEYTSSKIGIVSDVANNIGIFYQSGNVIFQVGNNKVFYKVTSNEAIHVVGQFSSSSMSLFVNGNKVSTTSIDSYKFLNEEVSFKSGTTTSTFIIDAVAFYKYNLLPAQIFKHYSAGIKETNPLQIVHNDNGYLFTMNASLMKPVYRYAYPSRIRWTGFINDSVRLSGDSSYLFFDESLDGSFTFTDVITVPSTLNVISSQIYWDSDTDGISISASIDGNTWTPCVNGFPLPHFNKNDPITAEVLYIKVEMSSADTSLHLPILRSIIIDFFNDKDFYSDNFGYFVSSDYDYALPISNKRALSYNINNGLRMIDGHGFTINSDLSTKTIEVLFTPDMGENVLFSTPSAIYEWNSLGVITKSGIDSIYVNGIDVTAASNIYEFFVDRATHHIIVILSSTVEEGLKFNQNQSDSKSGGSNTYNNLGIYDYELSSYQISKHYLMYREIDSEPISDTSFSISESTSGTDSTPYIVISVQPEAISI